METITVRTARQDELADVTAQVRSAVARSGVDSGVCVVYVPHTTAGVTVNECADPDVASDILGTLARLIPRHGPYRHAEGNAAAHVKASLVGSSVHIPIERGELALGTWQGVFLCEFDGPRTRHICVQVLEHA